MDFCSIKCMAAFILKPLPGQIGFDGEIVGQ